MIFSTSAFSETSFADIGEQLYVFPDGLVATTNLNSVTVELLIEVVPSGISATATLGEELVRISVSVSVEGNSATGSVGTVTSAGELNDEFGVSASGSVGSVTVWTETIPSNAVVVISAAVGGGFSTTTRASQVAAFGADWFSGNMSPTTVYTEVSSGVSQTYTNLTTGVSQSYTEVEPSSSPTWEDAA